MSLSLPRSPEVERSALGAVFAAGEAERGEVTRRLVEGSDPEDFFVRRNRLVFEALSRLSGRGEPVDPVTLLDELSAAGELDDAGGPEYLALLADQVESPSNLDAYLRSLRRDRRARALIEACADVAKRAAAPEGRNALDSLGRELREGLERAESLGLNGGERPRTAREILEDPDESSNPVVVAENLAVEGRTTLLAGREKSGKSTLLRWTAARRSAGDRVWGGPAPEGGIDVLWYGQEVEGDVARDLARFRANLDRVFVRDMRAIRVDRLSLLERDAEAVRPKLVVVDTLSTLVALMELDPGNSGDWERVVERLGALADRLDCALVISHHARKSDGEYRDSTAIGAGVDAILTMRRDEREGTNVRVVDSLARAALGLPSFRFMLSGPPGRERLELIDDDLSVEERVRRFVASNPGCSQRRVVSGVRGRDEDVRDALLELSGDGGPIECDESETSYKYRIADDPRGYAPETVRKRSGNGGTDNGGGAVSRRGSPPVGGSPPETPAGSVEPPCIDCGERPAEYGEVCRECAEPELLDAFEREGS